MDAPYRVALLVAGSLLVVLGCAPATIHLPVADRHPASPLAEEAPEDEATTTLAAEDPAPAPLPPEMRKASDMKHMDGGDTVTYTCPMHPDVEAKKPGECPKCGMRMTPKPAQEGEQ